MPQLVASSPLGAASQEQEPSSAALRQRSGTAIPAGQALMQGTAEAGTEPVAHGSSTALSCLCSSGPELLGKGRVLPRAQCSPTPLHLASLTLTAIMEHPELQLTHEDHIQPLALH